MHKMNGTGTVFDQVSLETESKTDEELLAVINSVVASYRATALSFDVVNDLEICTLSAAAFQLMSRLYARLQQAMETERDRREVGHALGKASQLFGTICHLAYGIGRGYLRDPGGRAP